MTCSNCGKRMSSRRENVPYDVRGLSGVTLVDVEVWRCSCCEEYEVVIPQIEDLHRTLARVVARVKRPSSIKLKRDTTWHQVFLTGTAIERR